MTRWADVRRPESEWTPEFRRAYERARRAYELGCRVRELRLAAGLSQRELASQAGTSQPAIARLEAGGGEPRLSTLDRISDVLGARLVVDLVV